MLKPIATSSDRWFDWACTEMDHFSATVEERQPRPDPIGSTIMHHATKWLPELAQDEPITATPTTSHQGGGSTSSSASITASWLKKKFIIESIAGMLPPERDSIPCDFLLRLLRVGGTVCAAPACLEELEKRAARRLGEASLGELMIPSFSHTCETLLDVGLVIRLVRRFLGGAEEGVAKSGGDFAKVGKLVDSYLAEAAVDGGLRFSQFTELADSIPNHARVTDDWLYRAVDTYLKAHPCLSKQERKSLWDLIDPRKLSQEAWLHVAQNERLPVRAIIQVLLSQQAKLSRSIVDWSGGSRTGATVAAAGKPEHVEAVRRLKEDVLKLQSQCAAMESHMEKLSEGKKKKKTTTTTAGGYFGLKKVGNHHFLLKGGNKIINGVVAEGGDVVDGFGTKMPVRPNRRRSMS